MREIILRKNEKIIVQFIITLLLVRIFLVPDISKAHHVNAFSDVCRVSWMSLVPVTFPHGPLALALVLPGPVGLLAILAAVGRVPATPVDRLGLALVTPLFLLGLRDLLFLFLREIFHF